MIGADQILPAELPQDPEEEDKDPQHGPCTSRLRKCPHRCGICGCSCRRPRCNAEHHFCQYGHDTTDNVGTEEMLEILSMMAIFGLLTVPHQFDWCKRGYNRIIKCEECHYRFCFFCYAHHRPCYPGAIDNDAQCRRYPFHDARSQKFSFMPLLPRGWHQGLLRKGTWAAMIRLKWSRCV